MKKSLKIFGGIFGTLLLLIALALILPFLIDLNQFKPQIQKVVANAINARLDFQSARLRILPGLGVVLKNVIIENSDPDFDGTHLFTVDEVFFQTELMPLFSQRFVGTVRIDKPEFVMARKGFKNNLTALAKPGQAEAPKPKQPETPTDPQAQAKLMQTIKESVVIESFMVQDASLRIVDLGTATKQPIVITDLDIKITNIGLDRDIRTELSTETQISQAGIKVAGPITMVMIDRITMGASGLEKATFDGKLSFDNLDINAMDAFVKGRGIALNVMFKGAATPKSLVVEDLQANLHNLAIGAKVNVKDLTSLNTEASVTVKNNDLARLGDVLPQHKNLLVKATLDLDASVNGPLATPTNVAGKLAMKSKLSGSDIDLNVDLTSLQPMRVATRVNSNRLDLGALLKPFMPKAATPAPKEADQAPPPAAGDTVPEKDFELTAEQKKMLNGADIRLRVTMQEFLFEPIKLNGFLLDLQQSGLRSQLNQLAVNGFGGEVRAKGLVNLEPSPIAFEQDFQINGVKADEFMALVKPEHKDLLLGRLTLQLAAKGTGTTRTTLSKTLNGNGVFKVEDAELHTPSVAQAMQKEFDGFVGGLSIVGAADKTFAEVEKMLANPLLKKIPGNKVPSLDINKYKSQYNTFKSVNIADKAAVDKNLGTVEGRLEIKDGRIYVTSKKAMPSGTFDFNGSIGLDMTLAGQSTFSASEALTGKMLKQSQYAALLFDDNKNLNLNMNLSGLVTAPKIQMDLSAIKKNFTTKAQAMVESELKKAADEQLKKSLGGGKEALMQKFNDKKDELKKKAQAEAKKQQDAAKKRAADEVKKKAGSKAKDKLKGLFGK